MTNVPVPTLTATGYVSPTEAAILAGVQADFNAAFGVTLNFGTPVNPTPQGQLAITQAATIGNAYDNFCALANSMDPAYNYGRFQDGIGRIYFLTRSPGSSTAVQCVCVGAGGTVIPNGTSALDTAGNSYFCVGGGVIPVTGTITLEFQCQVFGPIPCPANTLTTIFQTVPGWDTINNPADGVLGTNVQGRASFELERQQSVAANSSAQVASVLGAVLEVPSVLDAYVTDNPNVYNTAVGPAAVITGHISSTTLTVASIVSGVVAIGQTVCGTTGTGVGVATGTVIESGSGTSWVVNISQTVASTTMNLGGVVLNDNALYVAAAGGDPLAVATAIWTKKAPGVPFYLGNTTETVYDTSVQYAPPGLPYTVVYEVPPPLPFVFQINIANNPGIPANATSLVQAAVIAAFAGSDGGARAKIGSTVFASRYYAPIGALGSWAELYSIFLGTPNLLAASGTGSIGASFTGTGSGTNLTVTACAGHIAVGDVVAGVGVPQGITIVSQTSGASGTACTTTGTLLTVGGTVTGNFQVGSFVTGTDSTNSLPANTYIVSFGTGSGGAGTYHLNNAGTPGDLTSCTVTTLHGAGVYVTSAATTASSAALTTSSLYLKISAAVTGTIAAGQLLFDTTGDITEGVMIVSQSAGVTGAVGLYLLSTPQMVVSETVDMVTPNLTSVAVPINQVPALVPACIQVNIT